MNIKRRIEQLERRIPPENPSVIDLHDLFCRIDAVRAGGVPDPEIAELMARVERQRQGFIPQPCHADGADGETDVSLPKPGNISRSGP